MKTAIVADCLQQDVRIFLALTDFVVVVIAPAPEGRNVYSNVGESSL